MDFKKAIESKTFQTVTWTLLAVVVGVLIFAAGATFGARKAEFSYRWGENYHRNFAGPNNGFMDPAGGPQDREFIKGHGIFGQIIKKEGQLLSIKDSDQVEKAILVGEKTSIRRFRDNIKIEDLQINDLIVVIGEPNDSGQIEAKLIRVMPPSPAPGVGSAQSDGGVPMLPPQR